MVNIVLHANKISPEPAGSIVISSHADVASSTNHKLLQHGSSLCSIILADAAAGDIPIKILFQLDIFRFTRVLERETGQLM